MTPNVAAALIVVCFVGVIIRFMMFIHKNLRP